MTDQICFPFPMSRSDSALTTLSGPPVPLLVCANASPICSQPYLPFLADCADISTIIRHEERESLFAYKHKHNKYFSYNSRVSNDIKSIFESFWEPKGSYYCYELTAQKTRTEWAKCEIKSITQWMRETLNEKQSERQYGRNNIYIGSRHSILWLSLWISLLYIIFFVEFASKRAKSKQIWPEFDASKVIYKRLSVFRSSSCAHICHALVNSLRSVRSDTVEHC